MTAPSLDELASELDERLLWRHLLALVAGIGVMLIGLGGLLEGLGIRPRERLVAPLGEDALVVLSAAVYLVGCTTVSWITARFVVHRALRRLPLIALGALFVVAGLLLMEALGGLLGTGSSGGGGSSSGGRGRPRRRTNRTNLAAEILDHELAQAALQTPVQPPTPADTALIRRPSLARCDARQGRGRVHLAVYPRRRLSARAIRRLAADREGQHARQPITRTVVGAHWVVRAAALELPAGGELTLAKLARSAAGRLESLSATPRVRRRPIAGASGPV